MCLGYRVLDAQFRILQEAGSRCVVRLDQLDAHTEGLKLVGERCSPTSWLSWRSSMRRLWYSKTRGHRVLPDPSRELVIIGTPYIAAYSVTASTVRMLRVLHGAPALPEEFAED
ncbi:hypothetical protein ABLE91_27630 [Aquabacter sp. CN5-332]|uniref:hypothetical protein n=1 Tax=Aquabacter sp. CN5-332 TaxID=3156608 RepID=UPI0032B51568